MNTHGMIYSGPEWLQQNHKAAILNSRQSKYPVGNDAWIKATVPAVQAVRNQKQTLLTSLGMNTWELSLALASYYNIPTIVVVPRDKPDYPDMIPEVLSRFRLNGDITGFLFIDSAHSQGRRITWPDRDLKIVEMADIIYPVSIRPGGSLELLLADYSGKIKYDFGTGYRKTSRPRPKYDYHSINPSISDGQYLVHFTRSTGSPWPGETEYEYYQAVINSGEKHCHSAKNTLLRILQEGKIYASHKNIRGGFRVVGFTLLAPENLKNLFRYRPRLVNPYFEPFGIGLPISASVRYGIRPVIYGPPEIYRTLPEADRPFYQSSGRDGGRWLSENEWRHYGDFSLDRLDRDDIRIFVPESGETVNFKEYSARPVVPLFDEPESKL